MSSTSYRIISPARNGCQFLFRFHLVQCLPFEEEKNLLWPVQSLEQGDHESRIVQPFEIGSPFPMLSYLSSFAFSCVQVIKPPVGYVSWAFELLARRCWLRASWQPSWLWKKDFDISLKIMDPHNPPEKLHFTWFHWKPKVLEASNVSDIPIGGGLWWNAPKLYTSIPIFESSYAWWFQTFWMFIGGVCFLQELISQKHETLLGDPPYLVRAERFTLLQKQNPLIYVYI